MNKNVEHYLENMKKENFRNFLAKLEIEIKTTDDDNLDKKQRYELYKEEIQKKLEQQELEITTVEQLKKIEQSNSIDFFKQEMEQLKGSWRDRNKKKVWRWAGITWWFLLLRKLFKKKDEEKPEKKRYQKIGKRLGIWVASVWAFFGVKALVWEERWNNFKNKIGLGKEDEESEDNQETDNNQSEQNNETTNLTSEETEKRNKYITESIKNTKKYPITIDYWTDKTVLEAKWCPKEIWFDEWSQSILFGDKKLWLKTLQFTHSWANIIKTEFKNIKSDWNDFEITIKAKRKKLFLSGTEEQKVKINKDTFLSILSPYYEWNKSSYNVDIKTGQGKIPLNVKAKA